MSPPISVRCLCVLLIALWGSGCFSTAIPLNVTMEGSGEEPEFIFPIAGTTHIPPSSSPSPNITATFIRIKDFIFNQVVDSLKENLFLILVVISLLVAIIFIVCCASAMSQRRKLEVYYPPKKYMPRKYMSQPNKAMGKPQQTRPHNQVQDGKTTAAKTQQEPTKTLAVEKEDPQPKLKEVQQVVDVEEVEMKNNDVKNMKPQPNTSNSSSSQPLVCTCHLKKASPHTA